MSRSLKNVMTGGITMECLHVLFGHAGGISGFSSSALIPGIFLVIIFLIILARICRDRKRVTGTTIMQESVETESETLRERHA